MPLSPLSAVKLSESATPLHARALPGARNAAARRRPAEAGRSATRRAYLTLLTWAFTVFSAVRVLAYLPTVWAIHSSGDSSQHSLWTWLTWLGANATMAAWLYEQDGQRVNRAVVVNLCNASMCLATVAVIVAHRL